MFDSHRPPLSHQYDWGSAENRHRRTGIWSAQCEEITAVANDQVRRRKERRKALGALKAAMRKGDLVAAGQYQHLIEVYFGADAAVADAVADVDAAVAGVLDLLRANETDRSAAYTIYGVPFRLPPEV